MNELKPCPFCGATDEWLNTGTERLQTGKFMYQYVACRLCGGMVIDTDKHHCLNDVYEKWNTRDQRFANYGPEANVIKAGDEVIDEAGDRCLVTYDFEDGTYALFNFKYGSAYCTEYEILRKTGRHFGEAEAFADVIHKEMEGA